MLSDQQPTPESVLRAVCGSESRARLLRALFAKPLEALTLSELAVAAGTDSGNTLRALRALVAAGLAEVVEGGSPRYRPARHAPLFEPLRALLAPAHFGAPAAARHARLDEHKRRIGELVLERHALKEIRAKSLENLRRWRARGVWSEALGEWQAILVYGTNEQLVHVMTSRDEASNRLRQSMPYVGLLERKTVAALNEKVAA